MSAAENKAVFLSYASQDAEAVERIAVALRAAGVEVWFDQNELTGGDAWDAKIRGQIKSCVLFVPVISAATQARREGYFRLEWKLAAQRTHTMADGTPFLLPVVIDATKDGEALVPEEFRAVQWTRLPGGDAAAVEKFGARVKTLLGGQAVGGALRPEITPRAAESGPKAPPTASLQKPSRSWPIPAIVGLGLVAAGAAFFALRPRHSPEDGAKPISSPPTAAPNATAKSAPDSPSAAQPLLDRLRAIYEKEGDATAEDWALAMELGAQAVSRDNLGAENWAAYAQATERAYFWGVRNPELYAQALSRAQRAVSLSGDSFEARFALASVYTRKDTTTKEGERTLRQLAGERADGRVLRRLSSALENDGQFQEALTVIDRALAVSARDAAAWIQRARALYRLGKIAEAQEAVEKSLAIRVGPRALLEKAYILVNLTDDYPAGAAVIEQIPGPWLTQEYETWAYGKFWLNHRQPAKALAAYAAFGADTLQGNPKAYYTGRALDLLGRKEAAHVEWRAALQQVEAHLATKSNDPNHLLWRAQLLACLGERAEAERALAVARQFPATEDAIRVPETLTMLGQREAAISELMERWSSTKSFSASALLRTFVLHDPVFDPLRGDPRFQAFVQTISDDPRFPIPRKSIANHPPSPPAKSVAVLAFANLSADKDNEYFSDGIADELLTTLQKIPGLKVSAHTSAWSFKGKNATAQEIGEKLHVATLVEGSVLKSGNRVKITARLSRAATNEEIWSASFGPLELTDFFATQSEIAQKIVAQLRGQLTGEAATAAQAEIQAQVLAAAQGGTKNPEAHELYLQGKFFLNQHTFPSAVRATGLLHRAVGLDPSFALAWAALSNAGGLRKGLSDTKQDFDEGLKIAREAADRALALAPDLAASHLAQLSLLLNYDFNWQGAAESLRRATALAPSDPAVLTRTAEFALCVGQLDRAVEISRQALAVDPLNAQSRGDLAYALTGLRRFEEAATEYRKILEFSPSDTWARAQLSVLLALRGQSAEAAAEAAQCAAGWERTYALAIVEWAGGHPGAADAALGELVKSYGDVSAAQIAWVYAFRHDPDRAFAWLERTYLEHDPGLITTKANVLLASLHPDPRWPAFWKKIGLADESLK